MEIMARGLALRGVADGDSSSLAFGSVAALPSGRWLAAARAAPRKEDVHRQTVVLAHSDDEGATWSPPRAPFAGIPLRGRAGAFRAMNLTALGGRDVLATLAWADVEEDGRPFFDPATEALREMRLFLSRSSDAGLTWSPPELVSTPPYDRMATPVTGPALVFPDGTLALSYETNKLAGDPAPWRHASALSFSTDGGRTFPRHARVTYDPDGRYFHWDQRPSVLKDGALVDFFWSYDAKAGTYLNIHASASADVGRTWTPLWDTGVPGQPAPARELPDGRWVLVYVDRAAAPAIDARVSSDRGRTWGGATRIYAADASMRVEKENSMADAWSSMSRFAVGLPATAGLPDGDVLAIWYAGPEPDRTDIHWARLRG